MATTLGDQFRDAAQSSLDSLIGLMDEWSRGKSGVDGECPSLDIMNSFNDFIEQLDQYEGSYNEREDIASKKEDMRVHAY